MYVKGICRTNLDEYDRYMWPTLFYKVPEIGDRVLTKCGSRSLKVCGITHCHTDGLEGRMLDERNEVYVRIELHK